MMDCHIPSCRAQAMLNRYFCPLHHALWLSSPERERARVLDVAPHTVTMLSDFARRLDMEGATLATTGEQE